MTAQFLNTTQETLVPKDGTTQAPAASANQRFSDQANDLLSDPAIRASLRNPDNFYEAFKEAMPKIDLKQDNNITEHELQFFATDPAQPLEQRVAAEVLLENLDSLEKANPGQKLDLDFIRFVTNTIRPEVATDTFATDYQNSIFWQDLKAAGLMTALSAGACGGVGLFVGPGGAAVFGGACGTAALLFTGFRTSLDVAQAHDYATRLQLARPAIERLNILDSTGSASSPQTWTEGHR